MIKLIFISNLISLYAMSTIDLKNLILSYLPIFPEIFFLNFLLFVICYVVFAGSSTEINKGYIQVKLFSWLKFVVISVILILNLNSLLFNDCAEFINMKTFLFSDQLFSDWSILFFKSMILFTFFAIIIIFRSYCESYRLYNFELLLILLLGFIGSLTIISSSDLLILYIAIELQALAFYALAAFRTDSIISAEAAIKYFILGAFASILWLWGVSLIYGATGLTNFYHLNFFNTAAFVLEYENLTLLLGVVLILIGLLFKLGIAPFHLWLPDVYQGAPLAVTAFFSTIPKISLTFIFVKIYYVMLGSIFFNKLNASGNFEFIMVNNFIDYINPLLLLCGFLSIFIGSLIGIAQHNIKRLFAYSSIANAGFIILSIGCGTVYGLEALLIYLIVYVLLTINFFAILLIIKITRGASFFNISHFSEINSPLLGLMLSLNLFSLAGIPPLIGFYSKFFVYLALLDSEYFALTIIVAICTIFSAFFYIRLIALTFFIPSVRALLTEIITIPSNIPIAYIQKPARSDLIYLSVLTTLLNIFLFFNLDYIILLITKFILLSLN
jgi:NADH-quinone oxidoreductase subunit N